MAVKEIDLRRLVIKAFHMTEVEFGDTCTMNMDGKFTVSKDMIPDLVKKYETINKIDIQIIKPGDHEIGRASCRERV